MFSVVTLFRDILFFAAYVSVSSSFPEPLSKEEEEYYIDRYCNHKDDSARTKLIEHNLRLVAHIARKYIKSGTELDELISVGSIGLVKAVSSFMPKKGQLGNYASRCIENEILMFLRYERKYATFETSLEEPVCFDADGNEVSLGDRLYSDDDVQENAERCYVHAKLLAASDKVLDKREQDVIYLRYGFNGKQPLTQREIAKVLNVSRSYVSRIEKKALKKLQKELIKDNFSPYV